jgi:Ca2+-binding RTX toxin-like protein
LGVRFARSTDFERRRTVIHSILRSGKVGVRVAVLGAVSLLTLLALLTLAGPAAAVPYTGGFSPTIIGQRADLNGDGAVTGRDDSNEFYGSTHIIDGRLDCNAWGGTPNEGSLGDGMIDAADDCTFVGVDGTPDGVTIDVVVGQFQWDGPLPFVFNAGDPDNPDVGDSQFAWSTINGRVDSNGDETINEADCHFGLIGETVDAGLGDPEDGADILGNDAASTNPCGFLTPPNAANNGLVDLNSDRDITAADSCTNGCFFRHDVTLGVVQAAPAPPPPTPTPGMMCAGRPATHVGTNGNDTILGTSGNDVVNSFGGNDTVRTIGGADVVCAGSGNDTVRGGSGNDRVLGQGGNDFLLSQGANDTVRGGPRRDRIKGGSGKDNLRGQGANDKIRGQGGADKLGGGPGRDLCNGGAGTDTASACEREQLVP